MLKFLEKKDNDKGIKLKKATNSYPIFIPDFIVKKNSYDARRGRRMFFKRGVIFWIKQENESFDIYELERKASFNDICNSLEL